MEEMIAKLNSKTKEERLDSLRELLAKAGDDFPEPDGNVNNHIHTTFSFSPYSPTKAVYMARMAKLSAAGIMDHDSVGGVREFFEAGRVLSLPTTAGFELRVRFLSTPVAEYKINNPDEDGVAYVVIHGLKEQYIETADTFLKPIREARGKRNTAMCGKLSEVTGIEIDYEKDVVPLSEKKNGGSVTERHITCALSKKLIEIYGTGRELKDKLSAYECISKTDIERLAETEDEIFLFDLIGILKAGFVEMFYVPVSPEECPDIRDVIRLSAETDSILAYPYLGDVALSVTGDKKPQTFEDGILEELFETIDGLGIRSVAYMPARNTREQLERVRALCERYQMFQISGEDINSPRQPFISEASKDPYFENLKEAAWELIGR